MKINLIQNINIFFISLIVLSLGILLYVGIFTYNFYNKMLVTEDSVFIISRDDENSLDWGVALTLSNVKLNYDEVKGVVEIVTTGGKKVYSGKRTDFLGGSELGKVCTALRLEVSSKNPDKINMTGLGCQNP